MKIIESHLEPNNALLTGYVYEESVTLPESSAKPTVLVFPGGGYRHCVDKEGDPIAMAYLHAGFNAFVLHYCVTGDYTRGCPQKPADQVFDCALADAQAALRYLREHSVDFHIDPQRIATVGFSAGANLSASLNLLTDVKANAMVLGYGAFDDELRMREGVQATSLFDKVDAHTPPAFLFTTQPDATVPASNTLRMALALNEQGIPCECHMFVTGDHGLALANHTTGDENRDVAQWFDMSVRFLKHVWSGKNLLWGELADGELTVDSRNDILATLPRSHAILERYAPDVIAQMTANPFFSYISFRRFAAMVKLPDKVVAQVDAALRALR